MRHFNGKTIDMSEICLDREQIDVPLLSNGGTSDCDIFTESQNSIPLFIPCRPETAILQILYSFPFTCICNTTNQIERIKKRNQNEKTFAICRLFTICVQICFTF